MDLPYHANPLEAVQLISVFSYLNLLSDFLFIEYYLSYDDQNKQIPVVNALYEYLQNYNKNLDKRHELIRVLLQGSDLYGEQMNEEFDVTFVNGMFDYIISSLVFEKYGNVYGFIVDVVYKTSNVQIDSLLIDINNRLVTAKFENEYGQASSLSRLAVDRIFTDIILRYFPQPNTNLSLFSIDYIYAQAGSIFLQVGRMNNIYYANPLHNQKQSYVVNENSRENLFNEYVLAGYNLEYLLFTEEFDLSIAHAFALPAFCFYVFSEKESLRNTSTSFLTSDRLHLHMAFETLFQYLNTTFDEMERQLKIDNQYQIHEALSKFKTRSIIARLIINSACQHLNQQDREESINEYLKYSENYRCKGGEILLNLDVKYQEELNELSLKYNLFESESIKTAFGDSFIKSVFDNQTVINLYWDFKKMPYDLLEFNFLNNNTVEYYTIVRENYTSKLIKESDNPQIFQQTVGLTVEEFKSNSSTMRLKSKDNTFKDFLDALLFYRFNRLKYYLMNLDNNELTHDWWDEFGFSLLPYYPCLSDVTAVDIYNVNEFCEIKPIAFLTTNKNVKDLSLKIANKETRSLLSLRGLTFNTLFLRKFYQDRVSKFKETDDDFYINEIQIADFHRGLKSKGIELGFRQTSLAYKNTDKLRSMCVFLKQNFYYSFESIYNMLDIMDNLIWNLFRRIESPENCNISNLHVRTQNLKDSTGYGYKFVNLAANKTAQLRSNYELNEKILVSLSNESSDYQKVYNKVEPASFKILSSEKYYEIKEQLRMNNYRYKFSGIDIPGYNFVDCDVDTFSSRPIHIKICRRMQSFSNKRLSVNEAVQFVLSKTNIPEEDIRDMFQRYVLPEANRKTFLFAQQWIFHDSFKEPKWAEGFLIENQTQLSELRYNMRLEISDLTFDDANLRIQKIYTPQERYEIEKGTTFSKIVEEYNKRRAYFSATFQDYYALQNYATTGYTKITGDTNESRQMKIALYRLAIRQSDDPDEEFDLTLYKVEFKTEKFIDRLLNSGQKVHRLEKFTMLFANALSAWRFAANLAPNLKPVLYEMKFAYRYVRAKIVVSSIEQEKQSILLPGTSFSIKKSKPVDIDGIGNVLKVDLVHKHNNDEKYVWYKNIVTKLIALDSEH